MRIRCFPPLILAGALASPALATCPDQTGDEAAAQVRSAFEAWNKAVVRKDLEQTMAIFSSSIHFQVQGSPDYGYSRLLANYTSSFARENRPQWQGTIEHVISSPQMVTLFNEWKLTPAGGGEALAEYRGVDIFQREADCEWRVTASLNYPDKGALAMSPGGNAPGPAEVSTGKAQPLVAAHEAQGPAISEGPR